MGAPSVHDLDAGGLPPPETREVAEGVFAYVQPDGSWWINNAGFLVGERGVVSIDTCATERRTRHYLAAVERVAAAPVRTLVNTHHHGDHTNGNSLLPGATIIGQRRCREGVLATPIGAVEEIFEPIHWGEVELAPPFVTFEDRLDLHVDDLLVELHHVGGPAHTLGDVVAWLPDRSVIFAGDLVFNGGTPFVAMGSVAGSIDAVEQVRAFGAETIVPGHGGVCGPEVLDGIEAYLRFVQALAAEGRAAGLSPLDVAREADLGVFAELADAERIVGNLHRAYAEHSGAEPGAPLDLTAVFADMITYNGGRRLRCLA